MAPALKRPSLPWKRNNPASAKKSVATVAVPRHAVAVADAVAVMASVVANVVVNVQSVAPSNAAKAVQSAAVIALNVPSVQSAVNATSRTAPNAAKAVATNPVAKAVAHAKTATVVATVKPVKDKTAAPLKAKPL